MLNLAAVSLQYAIRLQLLGWGEGGGRGGVKIKDRYEEDIAPKGMVRHCREIHG